MDNGQVEKFNQTLLNMLSTVQDHQKIDWKERVGPLVYAYNVAIYYYYSIGYPPYYLMFGRHLKSAIDALLGLSLENYGSKSLKEHVRKLRDRLKSTY